jgi:hypothetical protein
MPPQNTMDSITEITNIGKICSLERASAANASPRVAGATQVAAISTNNSTLVLPSRTAPRVGAHLP